MVMHSNEKGRVLSTYPKWKRYDNAVDVVIRLHDRPILVPKVRHLRDVHTYSSMTLPGLRSSKASGISSVSTTAW